MKTNFNRILLIASFCLCGISLQAQRSGQPWWNLMDDPTANFDTVVHYGFEWFNNHKDEKAPNGMSVKSFNRWKLAVEPILDRERTRVKYIENLNQLFFDLNDVCTTDTNLPYWNLVGPNSTPTGVNARGLGVVSDLWINPNHPDTMYASAQQNGLYRTINGGATWKSITDKNRIAGLAIQDVLVDPNNSSKIFIGSGIDSPEYSFGMLKTTTGGVFWNSTAWTQDYATTGKYNPDVRRIAMHPTNPNIIYKAGKSHLSRTVNGGSTEDTLFVDYTSDFNFIDLDISKADPNLIYISGQKLYKFYQGVGETDLTSNVESSLPILPNCFIQIEQILSCLEDNNSNELNVYCLTTQFDTVLDTSYAIRYILRSFNQGASFTSVGEFSGASIFNHSFEKSKIDPNKFYAGAVIAYTIEETNGVWNTVVFSNTAEMHADIRRIVVRKIDATHEETYWCHDGGISKRATGDAGFTNISGLGLNISHITGFEVNDFYGRTSLGVMHCGTQSADENRDNWDTFDGGDGGNAAINPLHPNEMVYSVNNFLRTSNDFGTDNFSNHGIPAGTTQDHGFEFVAKPFAPKYGTPHQFYVAYRAVYNFNFQTGQFSSALTSTTEPYNIFELESCKSNGDVVWYAPNKNISEATALMKSTNGGASWTDVSVNIPNYSNIDFGIGAIEIHPTDPDQVWIGIKGIIGGGTNPWGYNDEQKVYYTDDGGATWDDITNGLPDPDFSIEDLEYDQLNNVLYAANSIGVWYRDLNVLNANQEWMCFNNRLPGCNVNNLKINECTRTILAGTWGRGLYEADLIETDYINYVNNFAEITSDSTMAGDHQSVRHIRVKFNSKLTITGTLRMAKGTRIEIEPGSELIVDGGTITNTCGELWEGIKIWGAKNPTYSYGGSKDYPQFIISKHGIVRTMNDALIENAKTAITLGYGPDGQNGGILYADNTTFKNNWRSIQFLAFSNRMTSAPYGYVNNLSKITDCNFFTTEKLHDPVKTEPYAQITMWQVKGVQIRACTFADSLGFESVTDTIDENKRIGILSYDATYITDPVCSGNYSQLVLPNNPCLTNPNASRNSFDGYLQAIVGMGINPSYPLTIRGNNFNNNYRGVHLVGTDLAEVYRNEFNVLNKKNTAGLYLDGSTGYYVEANEFFGPGNTSSDGPVGIVVRNSGSDKNSVTNNYMQDLRTAAAFFDDNDGPSLDDGFQYLCNEMANNHFDMRLTGSNSQTYNGLIDIAVHQGFCNPIPDDSRPAMNELQSNCTQDRQLQVIKPSQQTVFYHYFQNLADFEPTCFSTSFVIKDNCGDAEDDAGSYCLVNEKAEGSPHDLILDIQLDTAKIGLLNDSISIFSDSIHARIDDNNTNGNSAIMALCAQSAAYISNAEVLYLIEKKPSALDETDLLTCLEHLAPLSDDAAAALETNYNAVYNQLLSYIENNSLVTSRYTNTLLEMNHYERHIKKLREEVLRYWLVYDTTGVGMDSALAFLRTSAQPIDKMREGRLLARMGDTDQANSIFSSLSDSGDYYQNAALWNVLMQSLWADTAGISALLLDSNLMEQASDLAASEIQDLAAYNAKALLALVADSAISSPMYPEETSSNKKEASDSFFDDFEEVGEDLLTIYPNPANNQITLNFTLPDNTSEATLHLYGIDGRFIEQYTISSKQKTMELNVANFANGTYIYLLSADGKLIARKKLNVAK